jgi:hypothetical protein
MMARSFAEADLLDVLPRISVPTLLLIGDQQPNRRTASNRMSQ